MLKYFFLSLVLASSAFAGQLDLAVIQYVSAKDSSLLASGFSDGNLSDFIDSGSITRGPESIRGGSVIFAQTLPAAPDSRLSTSTRLGDERVDVQTSLKGLHLTAQISLFSGVQQALRSFTERNYSGEGDLSSKRPTIIAVLGTSGRSAKNIKGRVSVTNVGFTTIVVAQYR